MIHVAATIGYVSEEVQDLVRCGNERWRVAKLTITNKLKNNYLILAVIKHRWTITEVHACIEDHADRLRI